MLTPQERTERIEALRALMVRGHLSRYIVAADKDTIAKIMHPLIPPWEWERARLLAGLTASQLETRTGFSSMRVRQWEKGGGTSHPDMWVDYAQGLMRVVDEDLGEGQAERAAALFDQQTQNPSIQALIEQQRVLVQSINLWLAQRIECSDGDITALWHSMRSTMLGLRDSERRLRRLRLGLIAKTGRGTGKEGKADEAAG